MINTSALDTIEIILLVAILGLLLGQRYESALKVFTMRKKLILDSCGLIDGRILQLVEGRFLAEELVIPQFVLNELQLLADGNDAHKRERARFGLDVAIRLQEIKVNKVIIDRSPSVSGVPTDDLLVTLAKKLKAQLYTTDFNLGKIAAVEGISVLNINELAQNLRPITLPGETLRIKIVQKGSSRDQGVGYLEDGTMIVVDGGARFVGMAAIPVVVTRMHQTVAGKMVFGQVGDVPSAQSRRPRRTTTRSTQESSRPY